VKNKKSKKELETQVEEENVVEEVEETKKEDKPKKSKKNKKVIIIIILSILLLLGSVFLVYILTKKEKVDDIKFILNSKKEITLEVFDEYKESTYKLLVNEEDKTNEVKVKGKVDNSKIGEYTITYSYNDKVYDTLKVKVVDTKKPELTLVGEAEMSLIETSNFLEPGAKANDNYDGDISDNITIEGKVDTSKVGDYIQNKRFF